MFYLQQCWLAGRRKYAQPYAALRLVSAAPTMCVAESRCARTLPDWNTEEMQGATWRNESFLHF